MKVSQTPSDVQVVPLSSPHTNNMPLLSPPRQPPAIEFSIVELILQCAKLQSKDLAKFLKRLLEPNNSSKNSKEYREQAQTLVENIMSLLLRASSRDHDTLLKILPSVILLHASVRDEIFRHVLSSSSNSSSNSSNSSTTTANSLASLLNTGGSSNLLRESLFLTFEQRPSVVYQKCAENIELSGPVRSATLLLLGRMVLKYRRHARRISETGAWPALISVLRTERDHSVMTIALWVIVLLLPHVAGVLPEVLIDMLYILKRCLTSFGKGGLVRHHSLGAGGGGGGGSAFTTPTIPSPQPSSPSTPSEPSEPSSRSPGYNVQSKEGTPPFVSTTAESFSTATTSPGETQREHEEWRGTSSPLSPLRQSPRSDLVSPASSTRNHTDFETVSSNAIVAAAMEPYISSLFRFMYALFPHETLTFLQAECSANSHLKLILERRLHWMRFHPALLQPQSEKQMSAKEWVSHSPEELLGFADEFAIRSSELKPVVFGESGANLLHQISATSDASIASLASLASLTNDETAVGAMAAAAATVTSETAAATTTTTTTTTSSTTASTTIDSSQFLHPLPVPIVSPSQKMSNPLFVTNTIEHDVSTKSDGESTSAPLGSLTTKAGSFGEHRRSAFTTVISGNDGNDNVASKQETPSTIASIAAIPESAAGLLTPPKIDRIAAAVSPTVLTDHLVQLQHRQFNTKQGNVTLLSNELLYERYLRDHVEWKLRKMRRKMHSQSVQVKESSILRKQLRAQMRVTGDLQAAIAKEREQAKGYKQGHKKWSADMRVKVMRQREEYLQVVERNVELQNSVIHLRETITQLEGGLSATHTQLFQLNGVRGLYDQADKGRSDAEQRIAHLRREMYELRQHNREVIHVTVSKAVKCRDEIITKLSADLEKSLALLHNEQIGYQQKLEGVQAEVQKKVKGKEKVQEQEQEQRQEQLSSTVPRWLQAARSAQYSGSLHGDSSAADHVTNQEEDQAPTLSLERVREQLGMPNIIVRLQELIFQSFESQRNSGTSKSPKVPPLSQLKAQLVNEFGTSMYQDQRKRVEIELETAMSVDPSLYGIATFHTASSVKQTNKKDGVRVVLQHIDSKLESERGHQLIVERAAFSDDIQTLTAQVLKLEELLSETRAAAKNRSQELERRSMSMRQVNIALERRLMLAMQENENMKFQAAASNAVQNQNTTKSPAAHVRSPSSPPSMNASTHAVSPVPRLFGRASNLSSQWAASPKRNRQADSRSSNGIRSGRRNVSTAVLNGRSPSRLRSGGVNKVNGGGGSSGGSSSGGSSGSSGSSSKKGGGDGGAFDAVGSPDGLGRRMSDIVFNSLKRNRSTPHNTN